MGLIHLTLHPLCECIRLGRLDVLYLKPSSYDTTHSRRNDRREPFQIFFYPFQLSSEKWEITAYHMPDSEKCEWRLHRPEFRIPDTGHIASRVELADH